MQAHRHSLSVYQNLLKIIEDFELYKTWVKKPTLNTAQRNPTEWGSEWAFLITNTEYYKCADKRVKQGFKVLFIECWLNF